MQCHRLAFVAFIASSFLPAQDVLEARRLQAEAVEAGTLRVVGQALRRHDNIVSFVDLTEDGERCVSAGYDYVIRVWDLEGDGSPRVIEAHEGPVTFAAFCRDDDSIVTLGDDGAIRTWDATSFEEVSAAKVDPPHEIAAVSPDGRRLASCPRDTDVVTIRDLDTLAVQSTLSIESQSLAELTWSPSGRHLVMVGAGDPGIAVWDTDESRKVSAVSPGVAVDTARVRPDGLSLAIAGYDWVAAWSFPKLGEEPLSSLSGMEAGIIGLRWASSNTVVFGDTDGAIQCIDVEDPSTVWLAHEHRAAVTSLDMAPARDLIATGSIDQTVRFWDRNTGEETRLTAGNRDLVQALAWSADGSALAAGDYGNVVSTIRAATAEVSARAMPHALSVMAVDLRADGSVLSIGQDAVLARTDAETGELLTQHTLTGAVELPPLLGAAFHGDLLVCTFADGGLRFYDTTNGALRREVEADPRAALAVAFSPDGRRVVTYCESGHLRVFGIDGKPGAEIALALDAGDSPEVTFIDADRIAAGDPNGTIRVWNAADGELLYEMTPIEGMAVQSMAASPDGQWLVSCHSDEIRVWSAETGELDRSTAAFASVPTAAAFSPDGEWLATGMLDSTTLLWEFASL